MQLRQTSPTGKQWTPPTPGRPLHSTTPVCLLRGAASAAHLEQHPTASLCHHQSPRQQQRPVALQPGAHCSNVSIVHVVQPICKEHSMDVLLRECVMDSSGVLLVCASICKWDHWTASPLPSHLVVPVWAAAGTPMGPAPPLLC